LFRIKTKKAQLGVADAAEHQRQWWAIAEERLHLQWGKRISVGLLAAALH